MKWTPVDNNCGTGAGGFKPGNDCAKGAGPRYASLRALVKDVDLTKTRLRDQVETVNYDRPSEIRQHVVSPTGGSTPSADRQFIFTIDVMHDTLLKAGFKPEQGGIQWSMDKVLRVDEAEPMKTTMNGQLYIHPEGHTAEIESSLHQNLSRAPIEARHVNYVVRFANPKHREASLITEDAIKDSEALYKNPRIASRSLNRLDMANGRLLDLKGTKKYKELRQAHETLIKWHQDELDQGGPTSLQDLHRKAIGSHGIARDYYMDKLGVQNWRQI